MRRKKKIVTRKIVLIVLLVLCFILGYLANIVSTNRQLTVFEKALKDGILTVQNIITYPVDLVIEKINISKDKKRMYLEYDKLREQVDRLQIYEKENEELVKQINDLKNVLDLNNVLSEYEVINATIIGRDLAAFNENIIIDKGETSGIALNMPVVIKAGLIGKVVKTTAYTSTVRLLTSSTTDKISVKIKNNDSHVYGILSEYDLDKNIYIIEGITEDIVIDDDSIVTTTGMGDIYPAGIIIGKVIGIGTDNFDLSKVLEVESYVDFNSINYVTVLKRGDI